MHKNFLVVGVIAGGLAVALGAFGAHGLERITGDEKILHGFQSGVQYQFYHALALMTVAIICEKIPNRWVKWSGYCFIAGIILFSGSLYGLTLLKVEDSSAVKFVGPVTPIGGIFFLAGWLFLLIGVINKNGSER